MSTELEKINNVPQTIKAQPSSIPLKSTTQQARDEAVSALVLESMKNAGNLKLTPEESKALLAPFPDDAFCTGAGGDENLIYLEHAALRNRLNEVLGLGQWCIFVRETRTEKYTTEGKSGIKEAIRVYCHVTMLIRGCYVGDAIGDMSYFPGNAKQNYGDAFEGAKTAAFRRCAKEFGVGIQAWHKAFSKEWLARKRGQPTIQPPRKAAPIEPEYVDEPGASDGIDLSTNDFIDPQSGSSTQLIEETITPKYLNERTGDKKSHSIKTADGQWYNIYHDTCWNKVVEIGKQPMVVCYKLSPKGYKDVEEVRRA